MDWVLKNWEALALLIGSVFGAILIIGSVIASFTKTNKDDKFFARLREMMGKGKDVKDELDEVKDALEKLRKDKEKS